jgi:hypothetical protein
MIADSVPAPLLARQEGVFKFVSALNVALTSDA